MEMAGTCGRGTAWPTPAPQGSTRLLTEHQNVLAGRQLGPGAGGHFTQDRRPAATMTRVVSAGPPRTARPVNVCPPYRPLRPTLCPATPSVALYVPHHRLWPSSSSLVRSPVAATAGPLGPSSSFFSTPTGAILPTAATKRALPRAGRGPARTPAGPRRPPTKPQKLRYPARPDGPAMSACVCGWRKRRSDGGCSVRQRAGQPYAGGGASGPAQPSARWRLLQA